VGCWRGVDGGLGGGIGGGLGGVLEGVLEGFWMVLGGGLGGDLGEDFEILNQAPLYYDSTQPNQSPTLLLLNSALTKPHSTMAQLSSNQAPLYYS